MIEPLDEGWKRDLEEVAREAGLPFGTAAAPHVRALSEAYNALAPIAGQGSLAARLAFFFARDVPKAQGAARELRARGLLQGKLRVLDLGAGLGAATFGLARAASVEEAVLVDRDRQALELARAIARRRGLRVVTEVGDVDACTSRDHDLVIAANVLAESKASPEEDAERLTRWLSLTKPTGALVVIEPALKARARHLHAVRDRLADRVFAPCLHARPCPALAREGDWCHEDLPVDLPAWLAPLAKAAGLRWQGLTFAYLVLRHDGARAPGQLRIVSNLIRTKGKREARVCGAWDGLLVRLDRDASPVNEAFARLARGDLVTVEGAERADRVGRDTRVRIDESAAQS